MDGHNRPKNSAPAGLAETDEVAAGRIQFALQKEAQSKQQWIKTGNGKKVPHVETDSVICVCLASFPVFAQKPPKYEVATIMDVKAHPAPTSDVISYDVSVKVGGTIYLVLYTPQVDANDVKYVAGRELLVLIGKKTITYNDMLGQSWEVPIVSQTSAPKKQN
jgi:hypothetical protein